MPSFVKLQEPKMGTLFMAQRDTDISLWYCRIHLFHFQITNRNSTRIIVFGVTISLLQLILVVAVNWQIIKQYTHRLPLTNRISSSPSKRSVLTNNWVDVQRHPRISKISKKSTAEAIFEREDSF